MQPLRKHLIVKTFDLAVKRNRLGRWQAEHRSFLSADGEIAPLTAGGMYLP
jgi:hypothetical protein